MITAAWIALAVAGMSCAVFAGRYGLTVRRPGRKYARERHYMMLTSAVGFAAVLACAVLLAVEAHVASACLVIAAVVTVSMVWRLWLLQRGQHDRDDQQQQPDQLG